MDDKYKILLIDDEQPQLDYLKKYLDEGLSKWIEPVEPFLADNKDRLKVALEKIGNDYYDAIISDLYMPDLKSDGCGGLRVIEKVKEINDKETRNLQLIVISNKEDAGRKVWQYEIDNTAWFKFYKKAVPPSVSGSKYESREIWQYALSYAILKLNCDQEDPENSSSQIIGQSESINAIRNKINKVASEPDTVLITGESGTGKELVAKSIRSLSDRSDKPFVTINCGAIPEALIESELFGHEKGAFTGAIKQKKGLFEIADSGTLFLDEIGDLSAANQVKILRAIQEKEIFHIGADKPIKINVRLVAATNRNLLSDVREGKFREDLYYRINVIPIQMPSLRERRDDIPLLINFILDNDGNRHNKSFSGVSLQRLLAYDWPGNVRELQNIIRRCLVLSNQAVILDTDLSQEILNATNSIIQADKIVDSADEEVKITCTQILESAKSGIDRWAAIAADFALTHEQFKERLKNCIESIYEGTKKNKSETARQLSCRRATLYDWMRTLQIN